MEKEVDQMENCCDNMQKGQNPMMQQMMKHMQEFMIIMSNDTKEEKKSAKKNTKSCNDFSDCACC
jgi:hypothetical protein